jgi:hypothetical protein
MVGLTHKILHMPGPTENKLRYNLGVALHKLSQTKASDSYGGVNFVAAAKAEIDLSIELAVEAEHNADTPQAKAEVAAQLNQAKEFIKMLPKNVEAAEPFRWPQPKKGSPFYRQGGEQVAASERDAPIKIKKKKKKKKKSKKKKADL